MKTKKINRCYGRQRRQSGGYRINQAVRPELPCAAEHNAVWETPESKQARGGFERCRRLTKLFDGGQFQFIAVRRKNILNWQNNRGKASGSQNTAARSSALGASLIRQLRSADCQRG